MSIFLYFHGLFSILGGSIALILSVKLFLRAQKRQQKTSGRSAELSKRNEKILFFSDSSLYLPRRTIQIESKCSDRNNTGGGATYNFQSRRERSRIGIESAHHNEPHRNYDGARFFSGISKKQNA